MKNPSVLTAIAHAANLKVKGSIHFDYLEVELTKNNIVKLKRVAASLKYCGLHLMIEFKNWEDYKHLRIWTEGNTQEYMYSDMTLINIEHDLESLI